VPSGTVWLVIGLSVLLHVSYKFALARSYMLGELGYAYPLGRGFVPLVSTAIAFLLLGERPGLAQVLGIAVVCAGLVVLAMASIRGHFDRRLILPAAATGFTVAAYSALDAYGTRLHGDWLAYTCWLIVVDATSFALLITWMKGAGFWRELPRDGLRIVVSGAFGLLSFLVLLWALSRSPVGAVSALRECSVLFATIIGMTLHGERRSVVKIAAAGLIAAGLVITATARL
jgi:drug/metabolite transporter (DMT)-like permease